MKKLRIFLSPLRAIILVSLLLAIPAMSLAGVFVSITVAPPVLPVYTQPICPSAGYIWTPGYWAWGPAGYYWVPGVWVMPPRVGVLWTPGYWGFGGGVYAWHAGYWGPRVGFYGGVNYGFGYTGVGFFGGFWSGSAFHYNTAVSNVNTTIVHNVYNKTVVNNTVINRVSYNGPGGLTAHPTAQEQMAMRDQHFQPTAHQTQVAHVASMNRSQLASVNHGRPGNPAFRSVNDRRFIQQQRIAQGIRSGQMAPGEVARTERGEQHINHQVAADRRANGGKLTPQERQRVNREQNRESRQINREKHNGETAPR